MERKLGVALILMAVVLILLPCLRVLQVYSGFSEPAAILNFNEMSVTTPMGKIALPMNASVNKSANLTMEMMAGFFFMMAGSALGKLGVGLLGDRRRREEEAKTQPAPTAQAAPPPPPQTK